VRQALRLCVLVLIATVTACGKAASDSPTVSDPSPPSSPAASQSPTASAIPTSTLPPGVDQVVAVTFKDGHVRGPEGRVKIKAGSVVQLRVTSDVADEVHLHGYDKSVDVKPGTPATLTFTAKITGIFEVELEERKQPLLHLQVQ